MHVHMSKLFIPSETNVLWYPMNPMEFCKLYMYVHVSKLPWTCVRAYVTYRIQWDSLGTIVHLGWDGQLGHVCMHVYLKGSHGIYHTMGRTAWTRAYKTLNLCVPYRILWNSLSHHNALQMKQMANNMLLMHIIILYNGTLWMGWIKLNKVAL